MNPDSLPCLPEGALSGEEALCNNSFRRDSGVIRSVYREVDSFSELPDYVSTDIAVYDVVSDGITYFATHFYTCEWIVVKDGQGTIVNFFLAVGGEMCIIKILNCLKREVYSVFLSIAAHQQTLEGHAGIIKALRSFRNNSYLLLSGSTDGSIRLWDIRKATPLSVMTLFDGFSLLTSLDVSLCGTHFACTDCNGVVCIYTKKDDTFELEHTIYTGTGYRTLWVGELLLGVVNNVCTLYYPCVKTLNDSPTTVINVYRQYSMTTAPSSFCINNDASVLACLSCIRPLLPGLFHSTFNYIPNRVVLCGKRNDVIVLTQSGKILLYSPQNGAQPPDSNPSLLPPFNLHEEGIPPPFFDQPFDPLYNDSVNLV
ncbi:hypothetical protein BLSTO_00281 [Blastocystis sp. subtype 1]